MPTNVHPREDTVAMEKRKRSIWSKIGIASFFGFLAAVPATYNSWSDLIFSSKERIAVKISSASTVQDTLFVLNMYLQNSGKKTVNVFRIDATTELPDSTLDSTTQKVIREKELYPVIENLFSDSDSLIELGPDKATRVPSRPISIEAMLLLGKKPRVIVSTLEKKYVLDVEDFTPPPDVLSAIEKAKLRREVMRGATVPR